VRGRRQGEGGEEEKGERGEEGNLLPDVARTDALGPFVEAFAGLACVSMMHPAFTPVLTFEAPRSFALLPTGITGITGIRFS
jgi:hypothetical protein